MSLSGSAASSSGSVPREHLAHLERRVSIIASSCNAKLQPSLMRALGCRVQRQPLRVSILLAASAASELIADARASDRVAVVFSEPSTHRTVQLKGRGIDVEPARADERGLAAQYVERMVAEIGRLGYPVPMVRSMFAHDPEDLVWMHFTPFMSVDQTPGARPAAEPARSGVGS